MSYQLPNKESIIKVLTIIINLSFIYNKTDVKIDIQIKIQGKIYVGRSDLGSLYKANEVKSFNHKSHKKHKAKPRPRS